MISNFVVHYVALVKRARYFLVIMWIGLVASCVDFMTQFPNDTTANLSPPSGSPSLVAKAQYENMMCETTGGTAAYYYIESTDPHHPLTSHNNTLWNTSWYFPLDRAIAYWVSTGITTGPETNASDYVFDELKNPKIKSGLVWSSYWFSNSQNFPHWITEQSLNQARTGARVDVTFPNASTDKATADWFVELEAKMKELRSMYGLDGQVIFSGFGELSFGTDIAKATGDDMVTMFMIVLPLAMIIFCVSLSSVRYVILLICVLLANAVLSCGFLDIIAKSGHKINSLAPGIVLAFGLSLTTDYTYFIMCKYRKQVRNLGEVRKEHNIPLLELVLSSAGRTIFTSALVIICCSFGLLFLPVNVYSSVGWCALVCPLVALAVSLNLVPALLCIQPEFWMGGAMPNCTDPGNPEAAADAHMSGYFAPLFVEVENSPPNEQEQRRLDQADFGDAGTSNRDHPDEGTALRTSRKDHASPSAGEAGPEKPPPQTSVGEGEKTNSSSVMLTVGNLPPGKSPTKEGGRGGGARGSRNGSQMSHRSARSLATSHGALSAASVSSKVTKSNVDLHNQVSRHYQLVDYITRFPNNYVILFLTLAITCIPVVYAFTKSNVSNDVREFLPRGTQGYEAWVRYTTDFAAGEAFPFFWVLDSGEIPFPDPNALEPDRDYRLNPMVAGLAEDFLKKFSGPPYNLRHRDFKNALYDGPSYEAHPELVVPSMPQWRQCAIDTVIATFTGGSVEPYCPYVTVLRKLFNPSKEETHDIRGNAVRINGTWVWISLGFNPASEKGLNFYKELMNWKGAAEKKWGFKQTWVMGFGAETHDNIAYALDTLPRVVGLTFVACFFIITVMFGTPVVTLRCTLTVALAVACAFGFVNMVYVDKIFNFLGWNGLYGMGNIAWPIPFTVFLVSTGIAVNYVLISTIRSLEFYWLGVPTEQAIKYGAADSGREITVAAIMMMTIFSGLLFSKLSAMSQMGLYLFMTALVSGLIYRLFLTPPIMAALGDWNWWRPWPLNQFTPLVLPSGAETTRGTFEGEDFLRGPDNSAPKFTPSNSERAEHNVADAELYQRDDASGPVYRGSTRPQGNGYGSSGVDGSAM